MRTELNIHHGLEVLVSERNIDAGFVHVPTPSSVIVLGGVRYKEISREVEYDEDLWGQLECKITIFVEPV